jgi:hypothetical protein
VTASALRTTAADRAFAPDLSPDVDTLYRDGIVGLKGAFSREWAEAMREDMTTAFWEAIQRPGGAVGRGPRRWYVEIHPQAFSGFVDLVTHPWIAGMCEAVLGPEIAPGTQWDDGREWKHEMFPAQELWHRFEERAVKKYPQMGDVSCRSALTVHRGTPHPSPIARPVLVLGVDAPGAGPAALHDLMVTQDYYDALPQGVRDHLVCRVVDKLVPVTQKHDIEGLVMGAE